MKISNKIALSVVGVGLAAGIAGGLISASASRRSMEVSLGRQQVQIVDNLMDLVDRFLYERYVDIYNLSGRIRFYHFMQGLVDDEEISVTLRDLLVTTGPWNTIALFNEAGEQVIAESQFGEAFERTPEVDLALQDAFQGRVHISDAYLMPGSNMPTMIFAAPIRDILNRDREGVILGLLAWPAIFDILEGVDAGYTVHLYNSNGESLGDNRREHRDYLVRRIPGEEALARTILESEEPVLVGEGHHGEALIAVGKQRGYLAFPQKGWRMMVERPESVAFAPIAEKNRQDVLVSTGIILITTSILIFLLNRLVSHPIQFLITAVRRVGGGASVEIPVHSNDEIGSLGGAFNEMQAALAQARARLEEEATQLESKVGDLESTKAAMLNVLEDLSSAKASSDEARAKNDALLESIGEGVFAVDEKGAILTMNRKAQEMLGVRPEEVIGQDWSDHIHMLDEAGVPIPKKHRPLFKVLNEGSDQPVVRNKVFYQRKDGSAFPIALVASPVVLANRRLGAIEVFRDITHELEIDKAKTEFVSLASHQLRTPLSSISWFTEMLLAGDAGQISPTQKEYLSEVYAANRRMTDLVNAMLNVSRIELGTFVIEPKEIDIGKIAEEVVTELSPQIRAKHLAVRTEFLHPGLLNMDPKLTHIILQNLISNAVKYSREGGRVDVRIAKGESEVEIRVSDEGVGIPASQQPRIFTKLFRADNARIIDPEGNGLGLYLTKSIVEQSGGRIFFVTEEGKGTEFYVIMPISGMAPKSGSRTLT